MVPLETTTYWDGRTHSNFTPSGPILERRLLRTKWTFDFVTVVATFTVLAMSLTIIGVFARFNYPLQGIVKWWSAEMAIQGSM